MLFSDVKYALSPSFPVHRQDELAKVLDANGAVKTSLEVATHVITSTMHFEGRELTIDDVIVVTDEWVDRSIVHGKLQDPKLFSADPNMVFSGVIACVSDLEACDKEVISAGINALGGLFREGYTRDCTHVLAARPGSDKYKTAMHYKPATRVHVVLPHWFDDCFKLFTRLPEDPYAWPDPPLLRTDQRFKKARLPDTTRSLVKTDVLAERPAVEQIKALVAIQTDIWHGKRVLLSSDLGLDLSRREAVQVSIQRAGGQSVASSEDGTDIDGADVYITQYRTGSAFVKAVRAHKTVGTLSWLFNVHRTGVVSRPQDQLLHFPTLPEPVNGFSNHKITATNYEGDARRYLKKLIELMGAEFTPQMTSSNTVVVAAFIGGDKTTKAREWNIPVVNHTWLEDCFLAWSLITPAQEKYVGFPAGINFGAFVGGRKIEPLNEEALVEIERADEERKRTAVAKAEEDKKERERLESKEKLEVEKEREGLEKEELTKVLEEKERKVLAEEPVRTVRRTGAYVALDENISPEPAKSLKVPRRKSISKSRPSRPGPSRNSRKMRVESDIEGEDGDRNDTEFASAPEQIEEEELQATGLPPKAGPSNFLKAILTGKTNTKSGTAESDRKSDDEEVSHRRGRLKKSSPMKKPKRKASVIEEDDGSESGEPAKVGRGASSRKLVTAKRANGKSKSVDSESDKDMVGKGSANNAKHIGSEAVSEEEEALPRRAGRPRQITKSKGSTVISTIKPKTTPAASTSKLSLLDVDDLDTSSDDGLSPIGPIAREANNPPAQSKGGKLSRAHPDVKGNEDDTDLEVPMKAGPASSQKAQKGSAVASSSSTSLNQKARLRKQSSTTGPTPGKTVAVEIISPRRVPAALNRARSLVVVAADVASAHSTPKRGRPKGRTRAPPPEVRDPSPLSPCDSPTGPIQFSEEAIRRSSLPTPILGLSGVQRTPSRRQAATRATMRLHEIAPDILNFQKEMRTGVIRGPWEGKKGDNEVKREPKEGKKRRASILSDGMSNEDDAEEVSARDRKKRKIGDDTRKPVSSRKGPKKPTALQEDGENNTQDSGMSSNGLIASGLCLMTTQVALGENITKSLRQLGVRMASKPSECTLLLANSIGRTEKFLCAMATARFIVTEKWATDSAQAKRIMPPEEYFLNDPEGERKHNIKLSESLRRAQSSTRKLLEGHTFYFTKKLQQSDRFNTYKNVITSAGGKAVAQNPTVRILANHKDRHVLSVPEDDAVWQGLASEGFRIYVAEFILMGVLAQKMEWGSTVHRLDNNL
ncbi:hypothetical protein M0805_001717 [Coniferiporia weirii]|nr:hypothetical protein M0805_001717 [Coniferiporia weirii]